MPRGNCVKKWESALAESRDKLSKDAGEIPRLVALTKAADKVNAMIRNDLLRLRLMGAKPTRDNTALDYFN